MLTQLSPFWPHLATTLQHRPYVFVFLLCFLIFASLELGFKRMLVFLIAGGMLAFASEASSIRNGFPYGHYQYIYENLKGELLLWGVPLWDSLSYTFLAYASYSTAILIRIKQRPPNFAQWKTGAASWKTLFLMVILMTGIDVIIDPLTALGDQWFLGKIYYYPQGGLYFGVPLSNFFGWALVAFVIGFSFQKIDGYIAPPAQTRNPLRSLGILLYLGVYFFNWGITLYLNLWKLAIADLILVSPLIIFLLAKERKDLMPAPPFRFPSDKVERALGESPPSLSKKPADI